MPKYLTQDWLDQWKSFAAELPEEPGANARSQTVVTGTPDGDVTYHMVVENGQIADLQMRPDPDANFTITMAYSDALEIQRGEVEMAAAFMQGKLKVVGDMGKLTALMPLTQSPYYREMQEKLRAETEF